LLAALLGVGLVDADSVGPDKAGTVGVAEAVERGVEATCDEEVVAAAGLVELLHGVAPA
jgi:hypothetical protein